MYRRIVRLLVRLYPHSWRERYGEELAATAAELDQQRERSKAAVLGGILVAGVHARIEDLAVRLGRWTMLGLGGVTLAGSAAVIVLVSVGTGGSALGTLQSHSPIAAATLQNRIRGLCGPTTAGKRVTLVEMNPATGQILARTSRRCAASS
jgi:hypothetical protein